MVSVGTIVWLSSELMFFAALFAAYFTIRSVSPEKATSAIVVSYYWHFVDVVWIGLYATIYILQ